MPDRHPPQTPPLKVFILAGQSNMQGHAKDSTLVHLTMDPATKPLLDKIRDGEGKARVFEDVQIAYLSGEGSGNDYKPTERKGALTTGFGADTGKIGPELTFGITMHEKLKQPILLIKTAWGGKSLNTEFRPPSAGEHPIADRRETSGVFYQRMIEYVKKVLADPGQYHPAYDPKQGYEIAGMVWFQGFNDSVDRAAYPDGDMSAYSDLLAHLIWEGKEQIDAPCGYASGVCEALLQSHVTLHETDSEFEVHLLPALPPSWPSGRVKGLRARGGLTVDIEWQDHKVTRFTIRSDKPRSVKVRVHGETKTVQTENFQPE